MGLTPRQVLSRVELPLAVPAIIGGLRIAVVSTISIATIAGVPRCRKGLGYPIFLALADADAVQDGDLLRRRARRRARARVRRRARRAAARARPRGAAYESPTPPTRTRSSRRSASSATTRASSLTRRSSSSSSRARRSAIALAVALPLGIVLGHLHRGSGFAIGASIVGRALPSLVLIARLPDHPRDRLRQQHGRARRARDRADPDERLRRRRRRRPRRRRGGARHGHDAARRSCAGSSCRSRCRCSSPASASRRSRSSRPRRSPRSPAAAASATSSSTRRATGSPACSGRRSA